MFFSCPVPAAPSLHIILTWVFVSSFGLYANFLFYALLFYSYIYVYTIACVHCVLRKFVHAYLACTLMFVRAYDLCPRVFVGTCVCRMYARTMLVRVRLWSMRTSGSHIPDDEIRQAEDKFAESLHLAQIGMFNLLDNDVSYILLCILNLWAKKGRETIF